MKDRKAMGGDGIENEIWKYGGEKVKEGLWEICRKVWKGEGWPNDWKIRYIVPVVKKGEGENVGDYRGGL